MIDPDIDPSSPTFAADVEARLKAYEEEYSIETYPSEHRNHLGASSIGDDCWRRIWFQFRWVKLQQAEGRMRRLWNRGHREEQQFEQFLLWAGLKVRSINTETNKQYRFSKVHGHYGGSTDGVSLIGWASDYPIIVEFKTFADKYFKELIKDKVKVSNPKYYAQMCSYGREFEVKHALFYAVNKDNDEWYRELVELDWNKAIELEKKAEEIITATKPPQRISEKSAYYQCSYCTFRGICHYGDKVEVNCRSCVNATPSENARWTCKLYGLIPPAAIKDGCPQHKGIV